MAIDPKLIDDLNSRRKKVILSGGQEKIDKRHEKGEMTARDRMGYLFEEGTFSEIGMHVRHNCHNFGMGKKEIPGRRRRFRFRPGGRPPVACAASFPGPGRFPRLHARHENCGCSEVCAESRHPDGDRERLRRRAPPGRSGGPFRICPGVLQQRACLRRGSANLHDPGPLRGRRGLLPRPDGLHHHAQFRQRGHVHHRSQSD